MINNTSTKKTTLFFFNISGVALFIILLACAHHFEKIEDKKLFLFSFEVSKSIIVDLLVHLSAAAIIGVIVTNFLKHFNEMDLANKLDELREEIKSISHTIQYVSVETGLLKAIDHLKRIDIENGTIYTIGIGKSEFYRNSPAIKEYYKTTERILKAEKSKVIYKRITTTSISQKNFIEHLENCLEVNEDEIRATILLSSNDLIVSDTYLIIGNSFLFISPTSTEGIGNKKIIGNKCFITEDEDVIEQYTEHFDDLWKRNESEAKIVIVKENLRPILIKEVR